LEAHVDSCLADLGRRQDEQRRRQHEDDVDVVGNEDEELMLRATDGVNLRGLGFHTRDQNDQDVDEEVDVDGDDEAVFGDAQFTEGDILRHIEGGEDGDVQVDGDTTDEGDDGGTERKTLRDLVAEGKVFRRRSSSGADGVEHVKAKMEDVMAAEDADKMDLAVNSARRQGNPSALIEALENKIRHLESIHVTSSTSLLCRICLDPYTEPTVSTGCWHTCCRECWLRCLGSTKLCPICKRITAATDLRKIYL